MFSPGNGSLTFTFDDQTNAQNIETSWMLVNDVLLPDSGLAADATSMPLNGTGQLSNSQCEIRAAGAVVSQVGSRLTVTLPIRFAPGWSFDFPKAVWTAVQTLSGQRSTWRALGLVQVP
ncbi:MAG: hypothetical protein NTV52_26100 [Acidobacteria bacterium]|nr:hypothetical protein [Acidobacteriota bacterium]